ncbi:MAG: hypothetical protein CSA81_04430 [Acidobacteria bacterium]|nr:MAG: hypothetical protein CSA81_04430 [Acidobacteriota bacterium]
MHKKLVILFLFTALLDVCAQNSFYLRTYREGKASMALEDYKKAEELLEIAAFGFLDYPDYLLSCRVRLALIAQITGDEDALQKHKIQVKSLRDKIGDEHIQIEDSVWRNFLILTGELQPPPPALPQDPVELRQMLQKEPDRIEVWKKYIRTLTANDQLRSRKKDLKKAIKLFPDDLFLLTTALELELNTGKKKQASVYANQILAVDPVNALANEVLGNAAASKKRYFEAKGYYYHVKYPSLPQTQGHMEDLMEWQNSVQEENKTGKSTPEETRARKKEKKEQLEKEPMLSVSAAGTDQQFFEAEQQKERKSRQQVKNSAVKQQARPTLSKLQRMVKNQPDDTELRFQLVERLLESGNLRKTKPHLTYLGQINPNSQRYLACFSQYHYMKHNYQTVIKVLSGLSELNDKSRYYLGKSYLQSQDLAQAYMHLNNIKKTAVFPGLEKEKTTLRRELNPDFDALTKIIDQWKQGMMSKDQKERAIFDCLAKNDLDGFNRFLTMYAGEYPKDDMTLYFTARKLLLEEHFNQASDIFHRLANSGFRNHEVYFYAGYAFYKAGKPFVTKYMLEKAIEGGSKHTEEINRILSQIK